MASNPGDPEDTARRRQLTLHRHPNLLIHAVLILLLPIIDLGMLSVAFAAGYWMRTRFPMLAIDDPVTAAGGGWTALLPTLLLHLVTLMGVFFFAKLYHQKRAISRIDQSVTIFSSVSVGVVMTSGLATFLFKNTLLDADYPRQLVLYVWLFSVALVIFGRELHRQLTTRLRVAGIGRDRVLIVGSGEAAQVVIQQIHSRPELGYEIVGAVNGEGVKTVGEVPVIGHLNDLPHLIDSLRISEVILALPELNNHDLMSLVGVCQRGQTSIKLYPDVFSFMTGGMSIDDLGGMPLLTVRDMPLRGWKLALKRGVDIFGASVGLVLLSPLMILTAILIKLESKGPVFFLQERAGLDGRQFPMIKFRSMRTDAEKLGTWTVKDDPRVTQLGRWMRKTNWDEIPQLINVLLGQMSLVGPRPEQPRYVEQFRTSIPRYMERHREKSGMTGWAQVNGFRGDTSIEDRTQYDLYYVENWSVWLDLKIIIRTIIQTLLRRSKNAY